MEIAKRQLRKKLVQEALDLFRKYTSKNYV